MPPLPNTFNDDSLELILSLQRRQKDLSEFQIPRLRACVGPLSLQQDQATELREDIDTFARQLEVRFDTVLFLQNSNSNFAC
jgi:protein transport protein SEC20